jgi:hypothetical protein
MNSCDEVPAALGSVRSSALGSTMITDSNPTRGMGVLFEFYRRVASSHTLCSSNTGLN